MPPLPCPQAAPPCRHAHVRTRPAPQHVSTRRCVWHACAGSVAGDKPTTAHATKQTPPPSGNPGQAMPQATVAHGPAQELPHAATMPYNNTQRRRKEQDLDALGRHSHRVILAYDGTRYRGWQLQRDEPTVQLEVEKALMVILHEPRTKLGMSAAGRTDTGVHAQGQCVQFFTDHEPDTTRLHIRMNAILPPDIRVLVAHRTAPDFHVTITAQGKTYRYQIDTGPVHDPRTFRHRAHHRQPLDLSAMQHAAQRFVGRHDFSQFSNQGSDTARRNPVKVIRRVEVTQVEGGLQVEVEGAGFLYKQVRHMVGALMAVGGGHLTADDISQRLQPQAVMTAAGMRAVHRGWSVVPAKGLSLHQVHYPPGVDDPGHLVYPDHPHDPYGRLIFRVPDPDEAGTD